MSAAFRSLPQRLLIGAVRGYRLLLSPWLGSACRFEPTCSRYALDAIDAHGAAAGAYLALRRLGRCHPWCAGGFDPIPAAPPRPFARLHHHLRGVVVAAAGPAPSTDKTTP